MGGPGAQPPAQQRGQGGSMGILMPIYTIGIVIFFLYTVMKVDIFSSTPLDIFLLYISDHVKDLSIFLMILLSI